MALQNSYEIQWPSFEPEKFGKEFEIYLSPVFALKALETKIPSHQNIIQQLIKKDIFGEAAEKYVDPFVYVDDSIFVENIKLQKKIEKKSCNLRASRDLLKSPLHGKQVVYTTYNIENYSQTKKLLHLFRTWNKVANKYIEIK